MRLLKMVESQTDDSDFTRLNPNGCSFLAAGLFLKAFEANIATFVYYGKLPYTFTFEIRHNTR